MAKQIKWQEPAIDATIVVAGASILNQYVVPMIPGAVDLLNKIPDVMGISLKTIVLGGLTLVVAKNWVIK